LIPVGVEWEAEINSHLHSADIVILLISADFISSNYCYSIEMAAALARHDSGDARVIPVLLRDCLWEDLPFAPLQILPTDAKPVKRWQNRDAAWRDVAKGINSTIQDLKKSRAGGTLSVSPARGWLAMPNGKQHNNFFDVAAAGDVTVSAADEPRFAIESVRLCERIMRTISYREEDWWGAEEGKKYLLEQRLLLARGGRIERIFIIPGMNDSQSLALLEETLDQQAVLGIDVLYVYERDIPAGYFSWIQDFILYDERLLRVSTTVPPEGLLGRPAEVHTNADMVRRGLQWFNGLKTLCTTWANPD
jgi:hypothetical protein